MKFAFVFAILLAPLSAMASSYSTALAWVAGTNASGYNVYRATGKCPAVVNPTVAGFSKIGSSTTVSYMDSTVTAGTWCYFVTGTDSGTESAPSNAATSYVVPAAPTGLTVTVKE